MKLALVLALIATALVAQGSLETPPTFRAAEAAPAALLKSAAYTLDDTVTNDGFLNTYTLRTPFGVFEAHGNVLLEQRAREAAALAQLEEVSKTGVLAKALGRSVVNTGRGVVHFVTKPGETVKGIGGGLKRFAINLGRKGKRAADRAVDSVKDDDEDEAKGSEDQKSTGAKVGGAAGGAAKAVFGVNSARRRWAAKVGVDPYSTNETLQRALEEIAKVDAAGSIAARVAIPIPGPVGTTATIGNLVWNKDPEELLKLNESRLAEMGVSKENVNRFLYRTDAYTLTTCTLLVDALSALSGVPGRAGFVESAMNAKTEPEAWFHSTSARMLQALSKETRVKAVLPDSEGLVAGDQSGRAFLLLPGDYVTWNEVMAAGAPQMAEAARQDLGAKSLEARVTGRVSARAREELQKLGFTIREGVSSR